MPSGSPGWSSTFAKWLKRSQTFVTRLHSFYVSVEDTGEVMDSSKTQNRAQKGKGNNKHKSKGKTCYACSSQGHTARKCSSKNKIVQNVNLLTTTRNEELDVDGGQEGVGQMLEKQNYGGAIHDGEPLRKGKKKKRFVEYAQNGDQGTQMKYRGILEAETFKATEPKDAVYTGECIGYRECPGPDSYEEAASYNIHDGESKEYEFTNSSLGPKQLGHDTELRRPPAENALSDADRSRTKRLKDNWSNEILDKRRSVANDSDGETRPRAKQARENRKNHKGCKCRKDRKDRPWNRPKNRGATKEIRSAATSDANCASNTTPGSTQSRDNSQEPQYYLDPRNLKHTSYSWTSCRDDNCPVHYSDKLNAGWFPSKPRKCKYHWYNCKDDICDTHLWDKRQAQDFPSHNDARAVTMNMLANGICAHEIWQTCLCTECEQHEEAKRINGFLDGSF